MLAHKGTVTLTTPRLILRRFTVDDAQAMYDNWATDEKVTRLNRHKKDIKIFISRVG